MALAAVKDINDSDFTGQRITLERQVLCQLIENEGFTKAKIAEEIGVNRSYISQYANGKLYQSVDDVERKLREYFIRIDRWPDKNEAVQQEIGFKASSADIPVIVTQDHAKILGTCKLTQQQAELSLLVGAPGTGKTIGIGEYAKNNAYVYIITCTKNTRKKTLLRKTAEAVGIENYGASGDIEMRIVKALRRKSSSCLLVYDEADFLNLDALETVRGIYDQVNAMNTITKERGHLGILLCGNKKLAEDILVYAEKKEDYARLSDRIGFFQSLKGLGEIEADKFLYGVNCSQDAKKMLINIGVKRGIRQLVKALGRLLDVTQGKLITSELVSELGSIVLSFNA